MRKKRKANIQSVLAFGILLFLAVYGGLVYGDFVGKTGGETVEFTIPAGSGTRQISTILSENHIISHPFWFRVYSKLMGYDGAYQQGIITVNKEAGYKNIAQALCHASSGQTVTVTFPEGYELRQIADRLEAEGLIDREVFYQEIETGDFDYDFIAQIPNRENRLEGYLFPDTYQFEKTNTEKEIINSMLSRFNEVFTEAYKTRAKELSMTVDQVITLASVIEREALGDSDRNLVSGVFHNRLKSDAFPYLQSCATVQYILQERKEVLSLADTKINSPYNTYLHPGLPYGPIASPGEEAIYAALYPAETEYLFFVVDQTGKHHFSKTYEEHQQYVQ